VGLSLAAILGAACGLKAHPASESNSGGNSGGVGWISSGGTRRAAAADHGGRRADKRAAGGQTGRQWWTKHGGGGQTTSSGGQTGGSGGQTTSSGGQTTGSAGTTTGSGGRTTEVAARLALGGSSAGTGGAGTGGASGGSGGASGAGVTINGKFVPKEKAVVIIHFGHSNMRGQASTPTSLHSYFYDTVDGLWSYKGSFTLAKEPTAPEGTITLAGPGMAMLHSARAAVASTSDVQFISVGYGQGSATTVDYQKSGTYYPIFMKWAGQLKGNVTFGAIVIMLGITDGEHLAANLVPAFPDRVAQIVSDIRADLGEPNLPVLFCDYEQGATGTLAPTGTVGQLMMPLVRSLPGKISNLVLVPTDNIEMAGRPPLRHAGPEGLGSARDLADADQQLVPLEVAGRRLGVRTLACLPRRPARSPAPWQPWRHDHGRLLIFAAVAISAFLITLGPISDGDIYWHLAAGREILQRHELLRVDPFTLSAAGRPWIDVHWLFQLGAYATYLAFGFPGASHREVGVGRRRRHPLDSHGGANGRCHRARFLRRRADRRAPAGSPSAADAPGARDLGVSGHLPLGAGAASHRQGAPSRAWLALPLVQVIWCNCQGLAPLGPILVAMYLAGGWLSSRGFRRWPFEATQPFGLRPLALALALCLLASLASPYGLDAVLLPLRLLGASRRERRTSSAPRLRRTSRPFCWSELHPS
jgi:hypothetical protein